MRRLACLATALLTACTGTAAAHHAQSGASGRPAIRLGAGASLAAAQEEMFGNHYSAAEGTYLGVLAAEPRDADAQAEYALYLAYRGRLDEARAIASRAVASAPRDGHALAVLCRVDDWSTLFTAAAAAGRQATQSAPGEPLAHLFYSEALADTGDLNGAQNEIATATQLIAAHPTPYLEAEQHREAGNLAGDRGDTAAQLDAFRSAAQAQPNWMYRTTELVDTLIGAKRQSEARQQLDSVIGLIPDDALTLTTLMDEALSTGDAPASAAIARRALAAAPSDPALFDRAGEVAVAANHDINGAVADFEHALQLNPTDAQAAGYLVALARYAQHDPAAGAAEIADALSATTRLGGARGHPHGMPAPDRTEAAAAQRALDSVNAVRAAAGLPPVRLDSRLTQSAESHSYYWLFNNLSPTVADLGIHKETAGLPGYSGDYPWTRATAFAYPDQRIGEDITHVGDPVHAVQSWVDSVYHRFPILRPDLVDIGYADAVVGPLLIEDMEFGFATPQPATPVVYPASGETSVSAIFVDNELPDPVPPGDPRTTGYPVTVTFAAGYSVQLTSFAVTGPGGHAVAAYLLAPSEATENSASLLPVAPLAANTTYTASISAVVAGQAFSRTWTFTTA